MLEPLAEELYLTDRLDEAIAARTQALELRRGLGDVVAVGDGHRALSLFEWYAADRRAAERQDDAAVSILTEAGEARTLGYALANRAYLAAGRGDEAKGLQAGHDAQRIADELGDAALHTAASIGVALVRLGSGDHEARTDLIAARDTGLELRLDELVTVPMSNLAHHDVEQGRFAQADEILADALRFSEERDIPICSMWQRAVLARLRLLQGRWAEAEQDALAVLAAGDIPLGRLWSHLVLGLLAARRDAPEDNPHLDELWRTGHQARPARCARRGDHRARRAGVDHRPCGSPGRRAARDGSRRPARSGRRPAAPMDAAPRRGRGAAHRDRCPTLEQQPYERVLALWDEGSPGALLAALPLLDDLGAQAVAARLRGRLRELGVTSLPRGPSPATRTNPGGLTERQLDVLALLAEGLTNADIAARLFISRKTADHHVSAILGKLNARSRGQAVATARRLGLGGSAVTSSP